MSVPEQNPTNDLLYALAVAGVVETFQRLPLEEQDKFLTWIEKAPDAAAYWRRIDILVVGLRKAPPLTESKRESRRDRADFWTNPMGRM